MVLRGGLCSCNDLGLFLGTGTGMVSSGRDISIFYFYLVTGRWWTGAFIQGWLAVVGGLRPEPLAFCSSGSLPCITSILVRVVL